MTESIYQDQTCSFYKTDTRKKEKYNLYECQYTVTKENYIAAIVHQQKHSGKHFPL